jgi:hypothetical protein
MTIIILVLKNYKLFITKFKSYNLDDYKFNEWLKLHNPIRIGKKYNNETIEYLHTKYCRSYGINNVRSDLYSNVLLNDNDIKNINYNILEYNKYRSNTSIYFMDFLFNIPHNDSDDESELFNDDDWYDTDYDDD